MTDKGGRGGVEATLCIHFLPFYFFYLSQVGHDIITERLTDFTTCYWFCKPRVLGKKGGVCRVEFDVRREPRL